MMDIRLRAWLIGLALTLMSVGCLGQALRVKVRVEGAIPNEGYLYRRELSGRILVDSSWIGKGGFYYFSAKSFVPGCYEVTVGDGLKIPLLLTENTGEITILSRADAILDSARVQGNDAVQIYLKARAILDRAQEWDRLQQIAETGLNGRGIDGVTRLNDSAWQAANGLLLGLLNGVADAEKGNPRRWGTLRRLIVLMRKPTGHSINDWWGDTLGDSLLATSYELGQRLVNYLEAQRNERFTAAEQDSAYRSALTELGRRPMVYPVARRLLMQAQYLLEGTAYQSIADWIVTQPFGPIAPDIMSPTSPGWNSPLVKELLQREYTDALGKRRPLISRSSRFTLLLVWSVWCPHCQGLKLQLADWSKGVNRANLSVVGLSIDADSPELRSYVAACSNGWPMFILDEKHPLLDAMGVDGTPDMYLLDRNGSLVAHPSTVAQLAEELKRLEQ